METVSKERFELFRGMLQEAESDLLMVVKQRDTYKQNIDLYEGMLDEIEMILFGDISQRSRDEIIVEIEKLKASEGKLRTLDQMNESFQRAIRRTNA